MHRILALALTVISLLLPACAAVPAGSVTEIPAPTPTVTLAPTPSPAGQFTPAELTGLDPDEILLQQDYEPTFFRPETFYPFGRVPPFTLFADGRVIYIEEGQTYEEERVMVAQLSPEETAALVQQVLDLGFARLEDHTDFCQEQADGTSMCVADAAYTVLRARLPGGEFREVRSYGDFSNEPETLHNIRSLLGAYTHPSAEAYVPERAALFLQPVENATELTVLDWPLSPDVLNAPVAGPTELAAIVLEGETLAAYLAAVSRNTGDAFFRVSGDEDGKVYRAFLVPWLPGTDYTEALQAEFPDGA